MIRYLLLFFWFLFPFTAYAAPKAKGVSAAWEVGLWVVGGLSLFVGALKAAEWMLQSSGAWERSDVKLLKRQEKLGADLERVNLLLDQFLHRWAKSEEHLAELQRLHSVSLGERPVWWCAQREEAYRVHYTLVEKSLSDLKALSEVLVTSETKVVNILRALSRRFPSGSPEEDSDD